MHHDFAMHRCGWPALATAGCVALLCCAGCGDGATPEVRSLRTRFLTAAAPTDPRPLPEVRQQLEGSPHVVIAGRIGVPDQEPWVAGKAAFTVRDAADEKPGGHGGKNHDPATCPFCKRKASQPDAMAVVQFLDSDGQVISIDARELFDLSENQRVVVSGEAQLDHETLVVTADKLYVAQDE